MGGPVTIICPMAIHTYGNVVRGQEVPTGGCDGFGVEMSGVGGSVVPEDAGGVFASFLPHPLHFPRFIPLPRLPSCTQNVGEMQDKRRPSFRSDLAAEKHEHGRFFSSQWTVLSSLP